MHEVIVKELEERGFKKTKRQRHAFVKSFERKEKSILAKISDKMDMHILVASSFRHPGVKAAAAIYADNLDAVNCVFKGEVESFEQLESVSKLCFNNIKLDRL